MPWKLCVQKGSSKPPSPHIPFRRDVIQHSTEAAGGMYRQHQRRALQTSDAAGRSQEDASCKTLSRHEVVDGGRTVLSKDFDVSETPICYPLKIKKCPCDLLHVTAESLILLCPAQGKHRLANSYITEIHPWQRQPGAPTPLRRGSTRVLPDGSEIHWSIRVILVPE